jgi:hypothetical protein
MPPTPWDAGAKYYAEVSSGRLGEFWAIGPGEWAPATPGCVLLDFSAGPAWCHVRSLATYLHPGPLLHLTPAEIEDCNPLGPGRVTEGYARERRPR